MTRLLLLLCSAFLLESCDKHKEEEVYETTPKEEIPAPRLIEVNLHFPDSSICFYGYNIKDVSGFGLHPILEKLSIEKELQIEEGLILKQHGLNSVTMLYYPSLYQKAEQLANDIYSKPSRVKCFKSSLSDDSNKIWLSGIKNGKIWIGLFNEQSKEQILEWTGKDIEKEIIADKGYGEYIPIKISNLSISAVAQNETGYSVLTYVSDELSTSNEAKTCFYKVLFLNKRITDSSLPVNYFLQQNPQSWNLSGIQKWYNNSFLIFNTGFLANEPRFFYVYSSEGVFMQECLDMPYRFENVYTCSYTEYIIFFQREDGFQVYRNSLNSALSIWDSYVHLPGQLKNAKYTYSLLDDKTNIWKYQISILLFTGKKNIINFSVNINTGEILID